MIDQSARETEDGVDVPEVMCVGSATVDTIAVVSQVPGEDDRVLAERFMTAGGGPAATAAVALARLGVTVALCTSVGDDAAGDFVRDELVREGVLVDWVRVLRGRATAQSVVLVSSQTGARTIVASRAAEPDLAQLPLDGVRWVHVDQTGVGPVSRAERIEQALLSIDGGNGCELPSLAGVTLYAPSVTGLRHRYPDADTLDRAAEMACADGAKWVVATDGARGAHVRTTESAVHVPAAIAPIISTLGAGDVFHGALLAGLVRGEGVLQATQEASAAAALSCAALDGRSAIPTRKELDCFLETRVKQPATPSRQAIR